MDVAHADAGAAGAHVRAVFVQQGSGDLGPHAEPVVRAVDNQVVPFAAGIDRNEAVVLRRGHAVVNGVFQDGLDNELEGIQPLCAGLGGDFGFKLVFEADLLK